MTRSVLAAAFTIAVAGTAAHDLRAQAAPQQQPAPPAQASPAPAPQARAARPATTGRPVNITVNVTDGRGLGLPNTHVTVTGPVTRDGTTVADGSFRALGLKPGDYRFRFEREQYVTLERDVTIRSGQPTDIDVMLSHAPEPPKPEPAPQPPPKQAEGRASAPLPAGAFDVTAYLEREYVKSGPNRVKSIACSDTDSVDLVQTTSSYAVPAGKHQLAIVAIAGQGRVTVGGKSFAIDSRSGTTVTVPADAGFEASRQGKSTLVFVVVSLGVGCSASDTPGR